MNENEYVLVPQPVAPDFYKGKKAVFIGDSITHGVGASCEDNRYISRLAALLGLESFNNSGVSGNVMCRGSKRSCNIGKLCEENCSGADLVTVMMGVNDFNCSIKDGYFMLEHFEDLTKDIHAMGEFLSEDNTTVYGAMRSWCEQVVALRKTEGCRNTKFFFITPSPSGWNCSIWNGTKYDQNQLNSNGWKLRDLCEAMIETCAYYQIPVLDFNRYGGMYHKNANDTTMRENLRDGVHPNDAGHKLIAEKLYQFLLMNPTYAPREAAKTTDYIAPEFREALVDRSVFEIIYNTNGVGEQLKTANERRLPSPLPVLSAEGYVFGGWFLDSLCTVPAKENAVLASDIDLYAKWTKA